MALGPMYDRTNNNCHITEKFINHSTMNRSLEMIAVQYKIANYSNKTEQIKMSFIQ